MQDAVRPSRCGSHGGNGGEGAARRGGSYRDLYPGELTFLLLSTRIPARRDRGRVHRPGRWEDRALMVRWLSTSDAGPWSETASVTIGA